jgi:hypothetical protein
MGVPGDLAVDIRRDEDRSRLGRDLEPRCDIRRVAKNFAGRLHDLGSSQDLRLSDHKDPRFGSIPVCHTNQRLGSCAIRLSAVI